VVKLICLKHFLSEWSKRRRCFITIAFECAISKVQENQKVSELSVTHQLLVSPDDDNFLGKNINTIKKNKEALIEASREVGLEVNREKTKYVVMSHHQDAGQNHNY
jgi:histidinol-phosphate/aromatic aminotransferase/cobyric acid decarboxylase-like protein